MRLSFGNSASAYKRLVCYFSVTCLCLKRPRQKTRLEKTGNDQGPKGRNNGCVAVSEGTGLSSTTVSPSREIIENRNPGQNRKQTVGRIGQVVLERKDQQ